MLLGASLNSLPYIYRDDFGIYYSCIKTGDSFLLAGPMPTEYLNRARRHEYYRKMDVELDVDKNLRIFTTAEVLQMVALLAARISSFRI